MNRVRMIICLIIITITVMSFAAIAETADMEATAWIDKDINEMISALGLEEDEWSTEEVPMYKTDGLLVGEYKGLVNYVAIDGSGDFTICEIACGTAADEAIQSLMEQGFEVGEYSSTDYYFLHNWSDTYMIDMTLFQKDGKVTGISFNKMHLDR